MSQGRKARPEPTLFLPTNEIYGHIPKTHFYEQLFKLLDLSFVYDLTKPLYADRMGRPSLDPVVFFKCMLVGFFENIVYDTELEFRLADSLLLRRFLGYSLEDRTPDESTLRKTRQRMPEETFRAIFDHVISICKQKGLLRGRAIGMDSTLVDANASMDSIRHRELGCTYEEYILALRRQDIPQAGRDEAARADKNREGKASNAEWESATDPQSRIMQHSDGHTHLSYKIDATVDLETGVIVSAGADLANVSDQADCLERVDEAIEVLSEHGLETAAIVADKGHHSGENLKSIEGRGLIPLVASPNRNRGKEGFRRDDFKYIQERDEMICPAGKVLHRLAKSKKDARHYKAKGSVCRTCPHFGTCTTNRNGRTVMISVYDEHVRANRERVHSEEARPLMQIRRQRGEAPFGYFKQFGGLRRLAGRGLDYAAKKTLIAALGWNLLLIVKRMIGATGGFGLVKPILRVIRAFMALFRRPVSFRGERYGFAARKGLATYKDTAMPRLIKKAALSGGC